MRNESFLLYLIWNEESIHFRIGPCVQKFSFISIHDVWAMAQWMDPDHGKSCKWSFLPPNPIWSTSGGIWRHIQGWKYHRSVWRHQKHRHPKQLPRYKHNSRQNNLQRKYARNKYCGNGVQFLKSANFIHGRFFKSFKHLLQEPGYASPCRAKKLRGIQRFQNPGWTGRFFQVW